MHSENQKVIGAFIPKLHRQFKCNVSKFQRRLIEAKAMPKMCTHCICYERQYVIDWELRMHIISIITLLITGRHRQTSIDFKIQGKKQMPYR